MKRLLAVSLGGFQDMGVAGLGVCDVFEDIQSKTRTSTMSLLFILRLGRNMGKGCRFRVWSKTQTLNLLLNPEP